MSGDYIKSSAHAQHQTHFHQTRTQQGRTLHKACEGLDSDKGGQRGEDNGDTHSSETVAPKGTPTFQGSDRCRVVEEECLSNVGGGHPELPRMLLDLWWVSP